jgi:hypothetical protein
VGDCVSMRRRRRCTCIWRGKRLRDSGEKGEYDGPDNAQAKCLACELKCDDDWGREKEGTSVVAGLGV